MGLCKTQMGHSLGIYNGFFACDRLVYVNPLAPQFFYSLFLYLCHTKSVFKRIQALVGMNEKFYGQKILRTSLFIIQNLNNIVLRG